MELVNDVVGLVGAGAQYGVHNFVPIAVGAVVGGPLVGAVLGVTADLLGRAGSLVESVGKAVQK